MREGTCLDLSKVGWDTPKKCPKESQDVFDPDSRRKQLKEHWLEVVVGPNDRKGGRTWEPAVAQWSRVGKIKEETSIYRATEALSDVVEGFLLGSGFWDLCRLKIHARCPGCQ